MHLFRSQFFKTILERAVLCVAATLLALVGSLPAAAADLARVRDFLDEANFEQLEISPDGSTLAFITSTNDWERDRQVSTLWTLDIRLAGHPQAAPLRLLELELPSTLHWSPDGRALSFLMTTPDAGAQVFLLTPAPGATPRPLTTAADFPDGVDLYEWLPDGSAILVEAEIPTPPTDPQRQQPATLGDVRRSPAPPPHPALFKVALASHQIERLGPAPFAVPSALAISADGARLAIVGSGLLETTAETEVAVLATHPSDAPPSMTHNQVLEDRVLWNGEELYVTGLGEERNGRFTVTDTRLYRVADGKGLTLVPPSPAPEGGVDDVVALGGGRLVTVSLRSTESLVSLLDPKAGAARIVREHHGWIHALTASASGRIAFIAGDARHFAEIYVAESPEHMATARQVTHFNDPLTTGPLPAIETVSWKSSDGVTVEGVVFWPPGHQGGRSLPLIVDLHGGPFGVARTESIGLYGRYMSYPALLAARGYLVLNVNYRGSSGRGDDFARGIEGRLCSLPSDDVVTGVDSLVARGWADSDRVGAIGYSGGGTLTKCLAGRSQRLRAIATGAGVWDEIALFGSDRGASRSEVFFEGKRPWEDFARWSHESASGALGTARTPTLIVAGERDGLAPAQATEMYYGLTWRGVPTELLVFPGESHVFTKPSHRRGKIEAELAWFERYLRASPPGN